jgi:outer membrane protein W
MDALFRKMILALTAACLILAASAGWVMAQTFTAGTFNFEPRVGLYGTTNDHVNTLFTYGGGFSYYIVDNVALEAEPYGMYISQTIPWYYSSYSRSTNAFGSNFNARWHFVATSQATMYLGAGMGGLWSADKIPFNGYESSLTENGEIGATYALSQQLSVKGSLKYMHIGQFSDHGINAFGGTFGLNVSF